MAFSSSRRPYEMDDFGAIDELQLGERHDAILSSEGWNAKSKPASVLIADRRAIWRAILMRRFSRIVSSSIRRRSMASIAVVSPRSMPRIVTSRISRARGIFRPTRLPLMRSTMDWPGPLIERLLGWQGADRRLHRRRASAGRHVRRRGE